MLVHPLGVQKRRRGNDKNDDLISGLPDDVLLHMLSFMDTRTAAGTSILSRRWKHVWTCLTHLIIKAPFIYHRPVLSSDMARYCNWINNIVASNRAKYLDSFRIFASLDESCAAHLQNLVEFAFLKNVRNLEVNMSLKTCSIRSFNIFCANPVLECFHLTSVTIDGPLLRWILSNCHNLQRFSLHRCKISSGTSSESSKLVVSSIALKRLEFFRSISSYIKELHISASNLAYFMFIESRFVKVVYHKVPSLVDAAFGDSYCKPIFQNVGFLSAFSSQLEKLCLSWDKGTSAFNGSYFPNVKRLEIIGSADINLFDMISLIVACPSLHTFKLKVSIWTKTFYSSGPMPNDAQISALRNHKHLKALEFVGFHGTPHIVGFAYFLIRHAPMLKKITLEPRCPQRLGEPLTTYFGEFVEELDLAIRSSKQAAKDLALPGVEVVIKLSSRSSKDNIGLSTATSYI